MTVFQKPTISEMIIDILKEEEKQRYLKKTYSSINSFVSAQILEAYAKENRVGGIT